MVKNLLSPSPTSRTLQFENVTLNKEIFDQNDDMSNKTEMRPQLAIWERVNYHRYVKLVDTFSRARVREYRSQRTSVAGAIIRLLLSIESENAHLEALAMGITSDLSSSICLSRCSSHGRAFYSKHNSGGSNRNASYAAKCCLEQMQDLRRPASP